MHLKRMLRTAGVVVVASLSSATAAHADSELMGTVLAVETKKPLQDVRVTATSPTLEGERSVVTDAQGRYHMSGLPPGIYTLRFDKEAVGPISRSEVDLRTESTVQVDVELPGVDPEELEPLSHERPLIDMSSTTTGQSVEQGFTQRLALMTRFFAARRAEFVPGLQSEMDGFSIHGASPLENGYVVDGLSTQDPVSGLNASPLSIEFLQEFEVITGGYMPQYGRATGGILRARTRSGSNAFHGSLFGSWAPGFLEGPRTHVSNPGTIISRRTTLRYLGDFGATLGGPLVKDKLWFFAGVVPSLNRHQYTRVYLNDKPIAGESPTYLDDRGFQAVGKLTYLFNQDHHVSLSFSTTPTQSVLRPSRLPMDPVTGEPAPVRWSVNNRNFTTAGFQYAGAFLDKRLRVEAHLGWTHQTARFDGITNVEPDGLDLSPSPGKDRSQGNLQASWLLDLAGTHVLRAGVDAEHLASQPFSIVGPPWNPPSSYRYTSNLLGGFVQDSWTLFNRVTVNAGIRYDMQWLYRPDGHLAFALRDQLSPRVGLVVDPMAQGRMKLFAHYAKYRGQMPLGLMEGVFLYERRDTPNPTQAYRDLVDPDIVPLSSTELVAGAEYEVLANTRLSAHYTHRQLDSAIEDMSRDIRHPYFLGNPGLGLASNFPKAERTHDAVSVVLSRTFREGWLAQASYTWSRLHGNYVGPYSEGASNFDSLSLTVNRSGPLPYDRTHTLKLFGAREFQFTRELSASLGLSYLGRSGTPINYLGGDSLFGQGETFILPRGSSGERTPWVHVIDSNVGVHFRPGGDKVVSFTLDVLNLFNFQAATQVDENYTHVAVLPMKTGGPEVLPGAVRTASGGPLTESELNPNFKRPLQYQTPRQMHLGLRYTF